MTAVGLAWMPSLCSIEQQRLDRALREERAEREAQVRALPHLLPRRRDEARQALAAPPRLERERVPATLAELPIGLAEAVRRGDRAIGPFRAFLISGIV